MSVQVGLIISLDITSENRLWVGGGLLAGFAYGYFVGQGRVTAGRILSSGLIGGVLMGLIGNVMLWSDAPEPRNTFPQDLNTGLKMTCQSNVKQWATEGLICGAFVGAALGALDCILSFLFSREDGRVNAISAILGGIIQGGIIGLLLGTVFSLFKYCLT